MANANRGLDEFATGEDDADQSSDATDSEATDHDHDHDDTADEPEPDAPAFVDGLESLDYYLTTATDGHFIMGSAYRRAKAHGTDPTALCGEVIAHDTSASLLAALLKATVASEDGLSPDPDGNEGARTLYPPFVISNSDVGPDLCAACQGRYRSYYMEVSVNRQIQTDQFQAYLADTTENDAA